MANKVMQNAEKMKVRHERKKTWQKIVIFLCCVVVFCTTYALILPAITMEDNPVCGFVEHQHDESCFTQPEEIKQLICTDESDHVHDESCYHDVDVLTDLLICENLSEEHEHDETCYTKVVKQELDCKHEHSDECKETIEHKELTCETEHEHTDECYQITIEELDCNHTHTEECYKNVKEKQLDCEIHMHDDSCYEIIIPEKELICETQEHTHNESCFEAVDLLVQGVIEKINEMPSADEIDAELLKYEENEDYEGYETYYTEVVEQVVSTYHAYSKLTEEQKVKVTNADKLLELEYIWSMHILADIDLEPFITEVNVQHRKPGEFVWKDVVQGQVQTGDELRFDIKYQIKPYKLSIGNNTVTYQVPITAVKEDKGKVYDDSNNEVGTYNISKSGLITITFYDEYVNSNAGGSDIFGHIAFESSVDELNSDSSGKVDLEFKENIKLEITDKTNNTEDLQVIKHSSNINKEKGTIDYTITITSQNGTGDKVTLKDVMTDIKLKGNITVKNRNNQTVSNVTLVNTTNGFNLELPKMNAGDKYTITYSAEIPNYATLNGTVNAKNEVDVESKDSQGGKLVDHDENNESFNHELIEKTGKLDGSKINWTIVINEAKLNIGGWTLSDRLAGNTFNGTVTITPNPATGSGSVQKNLPYTFPNNSNQTYTITYSSTVNNTTGNSSVRNEATLTPPNSPGISSGVSVIVRDNYNPLTKLGRGAYLNGQYEGDNKLADYEWRVSIKAEEENIEPYVQNIDKVSRTVWVYKDELWNENIHWITGRQLKDLQAALEKEITNNAYYKNGSFEIIAYKWDGTGNKYRDPVSIENVVDENKYSQFRILFDGILEKGGDISFNYKTTVNVGNGKDGVEVINYSNINDIYVKQPSQSYRPVVTKVDKEGNKSSDTYHDIGNAHKPGISSGILGWDVHVTLPDINYRQDVIITENLPEGTKLLQEAITTGEWDISFENSLLNGGGDFSFSNGSNTTTKVYTLKSDTSQKYTVTLRKVTITKLELIIPSEMAKAIKNTSSKIEVRVKINDDIVWDTASKAFENTVTVTHNNVELGQADQTQYIRNPILLKSSGTVNNNIIPYSLTINEARKDLIDGSDTLTLIDTLAYTKPSTGSANASLVMDSVKVYQLNKDGTKTDISSQCPYTLTEKNDGTNTSKIIRMNIPDGKALQIDYSYHLNGTIGAEVNLSNTASIEGHSSSIDKDDYDYKLNIQMSNAGAIVYGVKIVKVDEENFNFVLQGAKFKLEKWDKETKKYVQVYENLTTNNKGIISTGELEYDTAYQFVEVSAPFGYEIDTTPYKFYIVKDGLSNAPENFDGKVLNNGDSIIISNKKATYELPETGGIGTHIFYIGGIALMLIAFIASTEGRDAMNDKSR